MTQTQIETQNLAYDVEFPDDQKWFNQKKSVGSNELYKFYLEHSEYKISKAEWREFMKHFSTNFFNYLCNGVIHVLPFTMGELSLRKISINGKQINWNASKLKYKELTGKDWKKGDSLKDCYTYHEGATKKDTFMLYWSQQASILKYQKYWKFHISSRYQWKRLLKFFTENPSWLNKLKTMHK